MKKPAEIVIEIFGGVRATARALQITPGAVSRWQGDGEVPGRHHRKLLSLAARRKKPLTPTDLVLGRD